MPLEPLTMADCQQLPRAVARGDHPHSQPPEIHTDILNKHTQTHIHTRLMLMGFSEQFFSLQLFSHISLHYIFFSVFILHSNFFHNLSVPWLFHLIASKHLFLFSCFSFFSHFELPLISSLLALLVSVLNNLNNQEIICVKLAAPRSSNKTSAFSYHQQFIIKFK